MRATTTCVLWWWPMVTYPPSPPSPSPLAHSRLLKQPPPPPLQREPLLNQTPTLLHCCTTRSRSHMTIRMQHWVKAHLRAFRICPRLGSDEVPPSLSWEIADQYLEETHSRGMDLEHLWVLVVVSVICPEFLILSQFKYKIACSKTVVLTHLTHLDWRR